MNPLKIIEDYFNKKNADWTTRLNNLGFNEVTFPILLKEGKDIEIVCSLKDFASDPDLYFHDQYDERNVFIDSKGQIWSWKYDKANNTNLPSTVKSILTLAEVKEIISLYFIGNKVEQEIHLRTKQVSTIEELFNAIADFL